MSLAPTIPELMSRARADLRAGVAVVISAGETAAVVLAAETIEPHRLDDLRNLGQPVMTITKRRAETLKARCYDGDVARILVPGDVSCSWINALADPANDLQSPMKGPLIAMRDGKVDLGRGAISMVKDARLLPAAISVEIFNGSEFAAENGLTHVDLDQADPYFQQSNPLDQVVSARVPLEVSKAGRLFVFRPQDGGEEHYAVMIGHPDRTQPVLTRLHSACFTGDLLGSLKCDCGAQLRNALRQMAENGGGVLLYLNQEGRGIGLANKMRAYSLQDQGFDTVEANHRLGFEDDERDFRIGSDILTKLGVNAVNLLTNNPAKVARMEENGIRVANRVPLQVGETPQNAEYLKTKAAKSGHIL